MKIPLFRVSAVTALCLLASAQSLSFAATVSDHKRGAQTETQPHVVLPPRSAILAVDWVDTKNAKLAIGGVTYMLERSLPNIVLSGGERVGNIGYLKSGMHVRIQTRPDSAGHARLVDITVVNRAD